MNRRLISFIIAALMLLTVLPAGALAELRTVSEAADVKTNVVLAAWSFENDPPEEGWTFVDADGDGENWTVDTIMSNSHTGAHSIMSNSAAGGLHPDNWAISPAVTIPEEGYTTFEYYGKNYSAFYQDNFRIYVGESTDIETMEPVTNDRVFVGSSYTFEQVDISAYAGQTVHIAIRHYNVSDEWRIYFDDISVVNSSEAPEIPAEAFYFESAYEIPEWTFVDADGDSHNWGWSREYPEDLIEFEGTGALFSESYVNDYQNNSGFAVTPDNWAISPSFTVPDIDPMLTLYAASYGGYGNEHFAVYAGTSADIEAMTEILPETEATSQIYTSPNYARYEADLSAFAGEEIHIAVRHFNCTDFFLLMVDKIEIWGSFEEVDDPYAIHEVFVNGWGAPEAGVAGIDHMFLETPDNAPYYLIYGGWRDETDQQQMWGEQHVFIPGHVYTEGCQIWAEEGYYFAEDCAFYGDGGTEILDLEWCRVDEVDNWICYLNSIEMVCTMDSPLLGDVDLDGDVDTADALLAMRYALGLTELSSEQLANAEVDGSESVTIIDAMLILRRAMELIPCFPVEE